MIRFRDFLTSLQPIYQIVFSFILDTLICFISSIQIVITDIKVAGDEELYESIESCVILDNTTLKKNVSDNIKEDDKNKLLKRNVPPPIKVKMHARNSKVSNSQKNDRIKLVPTVKS